jgi:hypothetical protein
VATQGGERSLGIGPGARRRAGEIKLATEPQNHEMPDQMAVRSCTPPGLRRMERLPFARGYGGEVIGTPVCSATMNHLHGATIKSLWAGSDRGFITSWEAVSAHVPVSPCPPPRRSSPTEWARWGPGARSGGLPPVVDASISQPQ